MGPVGAYRLRMGKSGGTAVTDRIHQVILRNETDARPSKISPFDRQLQ